jgi:hypothetical protein
MSDRTFARKKTTATNFAQPSLISSTTPTLANPTRGFGLPTNNIIQKAADISTEQQEVQAAEQGSLEQLTIQEKPLSHDISRISFRRPQAKLKVGEPGDPYEQEADWVANRIMRMAIPDQVSTSVQHGENLLQRKCTDCEEEEGKIQTKPLLQRSSNGSLEAGDSIESRLNSSKGGGSPLGDTVRNFMEPRFGADFSSVRVHTDNTAVQMSKELGAQAFTHGSDVYFGEGKAPGNNELTAHELNHVVQQSGDKHKQTLTQMQLQTSTASLVQRDDNPHTIDTQEEIEEINYVFFFANGDAYGRAARTFIEANYPDYRSFRANSLEQIFAQLYEDCQARDIHIGEIILISHAVLAPPTDEEEEGNPETGEAATTQGSLLISPLSGSEERVTSETLRDLQSEFREGIHRRFQRNRAAVIGEAIDENTVIEIRACRIGQDRQTMQALRRFFGGQAQVRASHGYQGYAILPFDEQNLTLEETVEILIEQGTAPASLRNQPAQQRSYVESIVAEYGGIPTQHFVMDEHHEAFSALSDEEQIAHISRPEQSEEGAALHTREQVASPAVQEGSWSYALDPSGFYEQAGSQMMRSDPELDQLSRQELEARAQRLNNPYLPENAPMLLRLRRAWEFVSLGDNLDNPDDPIAGLPPVEIFGEPGIVEADAERARRRQDTFEEQDIDAVAPTDRQRAILAGEPDSVTPVGGEESISGEASQVAEPLPTQAEPSRTSRSRRSTTRRARTSSSSSPEVAEESGGLRIIARDGLWLVFNRPAFRPEVVQYIWGNQFNPTITELRPRTGLVRSEDGIELDLGDTNWELAQTRFAARSELYDRMRPHVRQQIEELSDQSLTRPPSGPSWVPQDVWQQFLEANDGIYRYSRRSPLRTDIILIKREGLFWAGYAEAVTDETYLFQLMQVRAPSLFERLIGTETGQQAAIRWMADGNREYNGFMWQQVQAGIGPRQARRNYIEATYQRLLQGYIVLIGGSATPHAAGGTLGDILRATGVIPDY